MTFKGIQRHIKNRNYLFSDHADDERTKDQLSIEDVEEVILSGKSIEERLDDPRGESRLIVGIPSEEKWIHGTIRKR